MQKEIGTGHMKLSRILKTKMLHGYMLIFIEKKEILEMLTTGIEELVKADPIRHWKKNGRIL